jgi:hypothetical protein
MDDFVVFFLVAIPSVEGFNEDKGTGQCNVATISRHHIIPAPYKAVVQFVLLCGCETWVMSKVMMDSLNGFHHDIARNIRL